MSTASTFSSTLAPDALYEVVDGAVVELPSMSTYASLITSRLGSLLSIFAQGRQLGFVFVETLLILDVVRNLRRRPDVSFVSAARASGQSVPDQGDWDVVPDLAVEVTSPNDLYDDVLEKVQEYFRYGVAAVWVLWPHERQVYVYHSPKQVTILTEDDTLPGSGHLEGLQIDLHRLFQRSLG